MSYYFIAIGGSGAKVLESLTHLSAAGAFPDEESLYVMNIDPDVGNGNLARSTKSLQCYEVFQNLKIGYRSPLFRTKVVLSKPFTWNPTEHNKCLDDVMSYQAYKEEPIGHLYEVLYTKKERYTLLNEGFRRHPSIGAAVIAKKIDMGHGNYTLEGEVWSWLRARVNEDVKTGSIAKIFLVGSIFGGTGAAGLPTIAKLLRDTFDSFCASQKVIIGGGMVLPYFSFTAPAKEEVKGQVYAAAENFLTNTKAALRYYSEKNKADKIFDAMYFIGDSSLGQINKFSVGSSSQENDAHIVDFYVALSAIDFYQSQLNDIKICSYISHSKQDSFEWNDFPDLNDVLNSTSVNMKERMGHYIRFVMAYLLLVKPVLSDLAQGELDGYKYPWFMDYLSDLNISVQEVQQFEQYAEDFVRWLAQVTNNIGNRQISLINHEIIRSVCPADLNGSLLDQLVTGGEEGNVSLHEIWFRLCEGVKVNADTRDAQGFGRFLRLLYDSCNA